jgi:hypothetical protein
MTVTQVWRIAGRGEKQAVTLFVNAIEAVEASEVYKGTRIFGRSGNVYFSDKKVDEFLTEIGAES